MALARRLSENARGRDARDVARRFEDRAMEAEEHASVVRRLLLAERGQSEESFEQERSAGEERTD